MAISLGLVNFTRLIAESPVTPIILNDLARLTIADRAKIEELTTTIYAQTDVFSNQPSCECGKTTGGYNLGMVCSGSNGCGKRVVELFSQELIPRVWVRSPNQVAPLISPIIWTMLKEKFTKDKFSLVEWLCNTDYKPSCPRPTEEIEELLAMGTVRGYNNFVNNFDKYFDNLCAVSTFAKKRNDSLKELIVMDRDSVFSQHLPLPNRAMLIQEHTNVGPYIDPMILSIISAVKTIASIDTITASFSQRERENRTAKTIDKLATFHYEAYHLMLAKKSGLIRKNILGSRNLFSGRAVISSVTMAHEYDTIEVPWGVGVTMLELHLLNKLIGLDAGWTINSATALIRKHTYTYHPLLDQLLKEIIAESRDGGLYCFIVRNPSLTRGSMLRMKIKIIKTDPDDITFGLPILSVNTLNADFDGDQISLVLAVDNEMGDMLESLAPHKSFLDTNNPRTISSAASMPKPVASTINSWIKNNSGHVLSDPKKAAFMLALAS